MTATTKKSASDEIDAQMVEPDFWNNQERAQAIVEERKVARLRSSSRSTTR